MVALDCFNELFLPSPCATARSLTELTATDLTQTLTQAMPLPANSPQQTALFTQLREQLENQPHTIPVLCTTLLANVVASKDSAFNWWLVDLLHFARARHFHSMSKRDVNIFGSCLRPNLEVSLLSSIASFQTLDSLSRRCSTTPLPPLTSSRYSASPPHTLICFAICKSRAHQTN